MTIVMGWKARPRSGQVGANGDSNQRLGLIEYWLCLGPCSLVELADEQS